MLVLDTNVVSELMRERPNPDVLRWVDNQLTDNLFVTSVTEAEIRTGIAILPEGERQRGLAASAERLFSVLFSERILPFDSDAARVYAMLAAERRVAGRPISQSDCQIAAIARCRGASVATRDVDDFEGSGIEVINPWTDE
jgi:predicted nucleic acid-binding protein